MASMVALFSTLGENIPIFKREKILQAYSEGYINRLHYRATCLLIMAMTVMVTCPEWISGEGTYIGNAAHGISSTVSPFTTQSACTAAPSLTPSSTSTAGSREPSWSLACTR